MTPCPCAPFSSRPSTPSFSNGRPSRPNDHTDSSGNALAQLCPGTLTGRIAHAKALACSAHHGSELITASERFTPSPCDSGRAPPISSLGYHPFQTSGIFSVWRPGCAGPDRSPTHLLEIPASCSRDHICSESLDQLDIFALVVSQLSRRDAGEWMAKVPTPRSRLMKTFCPASLATHQRLPGGAPRAE